MIVCDHCHILAPMLCYSVSRSSTAHHTMPFVTRYRNRAHLRHRIDCGFFSSFAQRKRVLSLSLSAQWAPEVHHYVPDIPHVLVGLKVDLRDSGEKDANSGKVNPITTEQVRVRFACLVSIWRDKLVVFFPPRCRSIDK
jgi:GTPase SAR1 family protein